MGPKLSYPSPAYMMNQKNKLNQVSKCKNCSLKLKSKLKKWPCPEKNWSRILWAKIFCDEMEVNTCICVTDEHMRWCHVWCCLKAFYTLPQTVNLSANTKLTFRWLRDKSPTFWPPKILSHVALKFFWFNLNMEWE